MNKQFTYTALKYRPSQILEEQVNVGLVFLFKEEGKFEFIIPNDVEERVNKISLTSDSEAIKNYLAIVKVTATRFNKFHLSQKDWATENYINSILEQLIIPDSSSLFFDKPKTGSYVSVQTTIDYYTNLFFPKQYKTLQK